MTGNRSEPAGGRSGRARSQQSNTRRTIASIVILLLAVGAFIMGSSATFTDSTTANPTVHSGLVDFNISVPGSNNRLTVAATHMLPGDTAQRRIKLTNVGNLPMAWVRLTTTATTSSILDTDATNGLQMKIDRCLGALGWRSSSAPYTYTCDQTIAGDNAGTRSAVVAHRPIIGAALDLNAMNILATGGVDDLVVTINFPSWNGNSWANKTSRILYTFDGVQA